MNIFEYDEEGYDKRGFNVKGMNKNGTMYDSRGYDFLGYNRKGHRIGEKKQKDEYEDEYVDELLEEKKQKLYEETMRKYGNDEFADEMYELEVEELVKSYEEWEMEQPEEQTLQEELEGFIGMNLEWIKEKHPTYAKAISRVEGKLRTMMISSQCMYDLDRLEEISRVLNESDIESLYDPNFLEYQDEMRNELISLADIYGDTKHDYEYATLDLNNDYNSIINEIRNKLETILQAVPEQYRGIPYRRVQIDSRGNILLYDKDEEKDEYGDDGYDIEGYDVNGFNKAGIHKETGTRYDSFGETIYDMISLEDIKNTVFDRTLERYKVASKETREGIKGTKEITTEQPSRNDNGEQGI